MKGAQFYAIDNYIFGAMVFAAFWMPAGMWVYRQKVRTVKRIENIERG